jgi:hypothetical protein
VLTTVLAVAPPAFAASADDVGIELPAVPAAVMGGARFVKVAATPEGASGTDRVLELGPKTVTVEPRTTAIVEVAINHLNRIVTPFAAPQVRTVSTATTQVDGNVVYVATASEEPVALYLTDGQDPKTALSLTLAPRHLPPHEIRLQPSGGPWRGGVARGSTGPAQAQPYVEGLVAAFRDLAKNRLPTGRQARRDPYPALVRIKHDAILPNRFRADVRECFLVAAGYGDLASERAYLRTEAITCIREDGGAIEVPLDAYAVGEDGKVGVRGRLVSKQGQVIGKAMLASFAEGFSQMFGRVPVPVVATTAGTTQPFQQAFSGQAVQAGAVKGVGSALDRLANYFMDMAEEMFPVIEVDAGRGIEFVLNRGATLRLGQGRT